MRKKSNKQTSDPAVVLERMVRRLWRSGDRMAGIMCDHIKGHPMNCQCQYDKALREYMEIKRDYPEPSNG